MIADGRVTLKRLQREGCLLSGNYEVAVGIGATFSQFKLMNQEDLLDPLG